MGQPTVAEPVLFLQPTYAGAQEPETNGSWASAGAFCAGAVVAAGAVGAPAAATVPVDDKRAADEREHAAAAEAVRSGPDQHELDRSRSRCASADGRSVQLSAELSGAAPSGEAQASPSARSAAHRHV